MLRELDRAGVRYVLIGELAEVLHGSPLLTSNSTVTIVAGTHGYDDLVRDTSPIAVDDDLTIMVCSLVDLVRIADTSEDRARVPGLRRTLELAANPPPAARVHAA